MAGWDELPSTLGKLNIRPGELEMEIFRSDKALDVEIQHPCHARALYLTLGTMPNCKAMLGTMSNCNVMQGKKVPNCNAMDAVVYRNITQIQYKYNNANTMHLDVIDSWVGAMGGKVRHDMRWSLFTLSSWHQLLSSLLFTPLTLIYLSPSQMIPYPYPYDTISISIAMPTHIVK